MLSDHVIDIVDHYWASDLGCAPEDFSRGVTVVVQHAAEIADYPGIFALFRHATPVISVAANDYQRFQSILSTLPQSQIGSPAGFALALAKHSSAVIGPAFFGYADDGTLLRCPGRARLLTPKDHASVAALKAACTDVEWQQGGGTPGASPAFGVFDGAPLIAFASYDVWGRALAHISVVTHPEHRGRGFAKAAVAQLAQQAVLIGLIPQYRTLVSNKPALRVAAALGFHLLATSVAARISDAAACNVTRGSR